MKQKVLILLVIITAPIILAVLVSLPIFKSIAVNNDWIGFWGAYLGGLFTLLGVIITIKYYRYSFEEERRMSVIPYISITNSEKECLEHKNIIGLDYVFSNLSHNDSLYNIETNKLAINIGLGPAIDCFIDDIIINGNRGIDTNKKSEVMIKERFIFHLGLYGVPLPVKNEVNNEMDSKEELMFNLRYSDILGNKYKQKIVMEVFTNNSDGKNLEAQLKSVSKPELQC